MSWILLGLILVNAAAPGLIGSLRQAPPLNGETLDGEPIAICSVLSGDHTSAAAAGSSSNSPAPPISGGDCQLCLPLGHHGLLPPAAAPSVQARLVPAARIALSVRDHGVPPTRHWSGGLGSRAPPLA